MNSTMMDDITLPKPGYLQGHLLIATPGITESCFSKAVIYLCVHNENGAMGLIINHPVQAIRYEDLLSQLNITAEGDTSHLPIHFGGPVEPHRGFIVHTRDMLNADSVSLGNEDIAVTSNVQMLKSIASGSGPHKSLLVLGYAGWGPGQLEAECEAGQWISVPASKELVFDISDEHKWHLAARALGVDLARLSTHVGHA